MTRKELKDQIKKAVTLSKNAATTTKEDVVEKKGNGQVEKRAPERRIINQQHTKTREEEVITMKKNSATEMTKAEMAAKLAEMEAKLLEMSKGGFAKRHDGLTHSLPNTVKTVGQLVDHFTKLQAGNDEKYAGHKIYLTIYRGTIVWHEPTRVTSTDRVAVQRLTYRNDKAELVYGSNKNSKKA